MSHLSVDTNHAAANGNSLLFGAASSSLADIEVTAVSPPFSTSKSFRRKRSSIVSLAVSGGRLLSHRRGSAMPVLQHGEFDVSTKSQQVLGLRNDEWNRVQTKVMTIFEGGKLGPSELFELNEMVRIAIKSEIGSFISEYYKKSLLKRGMEALYNAVEDDGDKQLLGSLSKVWNRFYSETLPTLRAIFYPIQTKGLTMSQITLLGFRDHVLLRTRLKEALLLNAHADIPSNISQMLLVLQNIREQTHPSEDYLQLESLVALVVCPYLGTRGLYMGGEVPVIKANPPPVEETVHRHPPLSKLHNSPVIPEVTIS
ncbi:Proline-rich protein 5-like [Holothuria leucospilota]|uniref:Proline-rich protein 5-like n=1 Tax=Holothuria leucospilota TaxID=206669 RepID=A0A9Q1BT54_HOLLE|nr:Proline-rich protein 5-like [Holothuria leucospilota]